jgi:hypothetical protein
MCLPACTRLKPALALILLVSLVVLSGCAHHYLMTLSNSDQTISVSKPKLQGTNYLFTGRDGVGHVIPRSRVVKIKTISAEEQEEKPVSSPKPSKPKHWYFLWLA